MSSESIAGYAQKTAAKKENPAVIFDTKAFVGRLMDDRDIMRKTIRMFLEETPKRLRELSQKIKERSSDAGARLAHTIKGGAANVGGQKLQAAAARIETACETADWREAEAQAKKMDRQFALLEKAMREFLKTFN